QTSDMVSLVFVFMIASGRPALQEMSHSDIFRDINRLSTRRSERLPVCGEIRAGAAENSADLGPDGHASSRETMGTGRQGGKSERTRVSPSASIGARWRGVRLLALSSQQR